MKLKDKKIEILAASFTKDADGFSTETLAPIALPVWAYFRQLSGKEISAAQTVQAIEEVQFIIGWRDDITTAHAVRFRGAFYDITRVDTFEGYRGDIALYCKKKTEKAFAQTVEICYNI